MNTDWRQTVTNQQTILTVIAGLAVPAIVAFLMQGGTLSLSERRLMSYAVIALVIHVPALLLTAHNERRTSFMISQGQLSDPWRIVLSHVNNILYPIVNFSVLATWLFLLLIVFNRVYFEAPIKDVPSSHLTEPSVLVVSELSKVTNKDSSQLDTACIFSNANSRWEVLSAISTFLAVAVAFLGIAEIRSWVFRPLIRPQEQRLQKTGQDNGKGKTVTYYRLIVKNTRRLFGRSAKDVRVFLTYADGNQSGLKDFIPIPLRWTYFNKLTRDISRGEPAYLDVFDQEGPSTKYSFCWADVAGAGSAKEILKDFDPSFGDLCLEFYERNGGRIGHMTLRYFADKDYFEVIR